MVIYIYISVSPDSHRSRLIPGVVRSTESVPFSINVHCPYSVVALISDYGVQVQSRIITIGETLISIEKRGCFDNTFPFGPHCLEISPSGQ